ncbi:MAG: hypothetical protein Q8P64_26690, partial [Deltaproteobacteria bacterium]|nr:hypothetical protein [Deltaproteobacteria bacterium]
KSRGLNGSTGSQRSFSSPEFTYQSQKKQYRNRAGVLEKPCSGTFGSWLHAFLDKTWASPKVKSYVTLPFEKSAIARVWKHSRPGLILQHLN